MVLVDTSIWIAHFRKGNSQLQDFLMEGKVACHPFIIGELACENLKNRKEILALLEALPKTELAGHEEILYFIEQNQLMGKGLGYIDTHLLASTQLSGIYLWTLDNNLKDAAEELNLSFS
ncbi:MAG: type II toxin-antitoxin system VapC family toxin [Candidatus Aminicenantes bacterium]|nr:type II toxin-antitoxin system VapC family toxin [Candidatus Aminicenantes bacterium]